ncbi:unnamed protein product [Brassica rapa]|uniref:Uncharacterized protein n=1 Tax=Brassica campestris TaxID=3711 RepID=A0A3P6BD93_BRACM|nr:unnamed protein product [Brassica rapa]VDD03183.1 unnamed protein product [Brassica rapa]
MNPMREKQLVVGPPSKKRRWHRSEFVAVVTGLEIGGSVVVLSSEATRSTMNLMRKKQLVVGPPSKKRRWHKSEFVAVVTGLEIGGSVVVLSSEGEEFEVVMELCQSKALTSLQCSSLLCPLIDTPKV